MIADHIAHRGIAFIIGKHAKTIFHQPIRSAQTKQDMINERPSLTVP
jgi:hypothetical protein